MEKLVNWVKANKVLVVASLIAVCVVFCAISVDSKEMPKQVRNEPLSQYLQRDCYIDDSVAHESLETLEALYNSKETSKVRCENYFTVSGKDSEGKDSDVVIYKGSYQ